MTGARRRDQVIRDLRRLGRYGIELLTAEILEIDPDHRRVKTSEAELSFDQLVIALGAELAPEAVPGFEETAHNLYTLEGAADAGAALRHFEGGRVAILVSRLPYKCPAAPYEAAFLVEAMLRSRGLRERVLIDVLSPEPFPMPTAGPGLGKALEQMPADRGIGFHSESTVEHVDAGAHELLLADSTRVPYDLLLGVPAHRPPEVARRSGFAEDSGYLSVNRSTLETSTEGIFAIGDVTAIPIAGGKILPKAGVFAHAEAEVVVVRHRDLRRHRRVLRGAGRRASRVRKGRLLRLRRTRGTLQRPGRRWHLAKVAFEQYWLRRWL